MAIVLPNGIGELTGDSLVTSARPLHATGQVFYVSSATGDAASPGTNKARPLNTLANAQTAASNGDIIVLLDGHTETYAAPLTISKNLSIVASGSNSGVPTVTFRMSANDSLFVITAEGVQLRNIRFQSSTAAGTSADRILVEAASVAVIGCYFDCSGNDTGNAIFIDTGFNNFRCENSTFVATNTVQTTSPGRAIRVNAATGTRLSGVTFDSAVGGFSSGIAYLEGGAQTRRYAENINLLRGADVALHASSTQSYWLYGTTSGDARMTL